MKYRPLSPSAITSLSHALDHLHQPYRMVCVVDNGAAATATGRNEEVLKELRCPHRKNHTGHAPENVHIHHQANPQFRKRNLNYQDTFRIACIKPDGLMSSKNPRGWLINTLKNVIRNRRRTEARLSNALLAAMSAYEPQASTTVETTEFIVAYSDALGEEDFQLLVNIVVRRYTMLEAAEELGITVEACKKRVQRAKKKLQKIIEKDF